MLIAFFAALSIVGHPTSGLGVFPYRIDLEIVLGQTETRTVTVTNSSDTAQQVVASLSGLRTTPDGDLEWLAPDGRDAVGNLYEYGAIKSWAEIEPLEQVIAPHSTADFFVHFRAPESPGNYVGRVGAVLFDSTPTGEEGEGSLVRSVFRLTTFLLVCLQSDQQPGACLVSAEVRQPETGRLRFVVTIENTGNVHLAPTGSIQIVAQPGNTALAKVPLSSGTALPGRLRVYTADWEASTTGTYEAVFNVLHTQGLTDQVVTRTFTLDEGRLIEQL
jgi:hypothetical protein